MDLRFEFGWIGFIAYALPFLANIMHLFAQPPMRNEDGEQERFPPLEEAEKYARFAYAVALCGLQAEGEIGFASPAFFAGILLLALYYFAWFCDLRSGWAEENMLFLPFPRRIFVSFYQICAALWLQNIIALVLAVVFGAAHIAVGWKKRAADKKAADNAEDA